MAARPSSDHAGSPTASPRPADSTGDRLSGKVAVVTGAGSGIGAAIAAHLAGGGAQILALDIDGAAAVRTAAAIPRAQAVTADVTDPDRVGLALGDAKRIDILVNNAVVASDIPLEDLSLAGWAQQVDVALTGAFVMIRAVLPAMMERQHGSIVNISSVNAFGYYGNEAYSAAKAGLLSLTRSVAVRYGKHGIRCNAVVPGTIRTPIWDRRLAADPQVLNRMAKWYPLGRVGTPDDVAAAVAFLAGDDAAWITGVSLPVDGGLLAGNGLLAQEIEAASPGTDGEV